MRWWEWACFLPGMLLWAAFAVWSIAVFIQPGTAFLTYGCVDCDWEISEPSRRYWWSLRPRYRLHRVIHHRDWPR